MQCAVWSALLCLLKNDGPFVRSPRARVRTALLIQLQHAAAAAQNPARPTHRRRRRFLSGLTRSSVAVRHSKGKDSPKHAQSATPGGRAAGCVPPPPPPPMQPRTLSRRPLEESVNQAKNRSARGTFLRPRKLGLRRRQCYPRNRRSKEDGWRCKTAAAAGAHPRSVFSTSNGEGEGGAECNNVIVVIAVVISLLAPSLPLRLVCKEDRNSSRLRSPSA